MCRRHAFVILVALVTLAAATSGCAARTKAQRKQREDRYQAALASYAEVLKPGMTRKQVEDWLQAKGISFRQASGTGLEGTGTYADLIKIGHEHHPWYCEADNIYVAINFTKTEPHDSPRAFDSDEVRDLTIFRWFEGCM